MTYPVFILPELDWILCGRSRFGEGSFSIMI